MAELTRAAFKTRKRSYITLQTQLVISWGNKFSIQSIGNSTTAPAPAMYLLLYGLKIDK